MSKPELKVLAVEPVSDSVLRRLEQVRELAEKGEISAVAICTVNRDGSTRWSWSTVHNFSLMIGGVARMQDELSRRSRGDE